MKFLKSIHYCIITSNEPIILCAYIRMGNNGNFIEHMHTGAIGAAIDIDSGIICTPGYDSCGNEYIFHPYSGKKIPGYHFKNWDKCIDLVKNLAKKVPEVRMVGWDMVINDRFEWLPIEGNHNCGFGLWQTAMHKGLAKKIECIIEKEKRK